VNEFKGSEVEGPAVVGETLSTFLGSKSSSMDDAKKDAKTSRARIDVDAEVTLWS
jgi:hypothetical protein